MPQELSMLRVFDSSLRVIGYVDTNVAQLSGRNIVPDQTFVIHLVDNAEDAALALMEVMSKVPTKGPTAPSVIAKVENVAFYGPGKYADAPPDAVIFNLILVEYPDNLWNYAGWYKRGVSRKA